MRLDWEKIADECLSHFKSLHKREISNQKRFLSLGPDGEYKEEFGHEFDAAKVPRGQRHWLGKYKETDGVWVQEKLGIQVQDEEVEGMELKSSYDQAGSDTVPDQKLNVFTAYGLDMLSRGPKAKTISGSSGDKPAAKGEDTPSKADPKATKPDSKAAEERQATPLKGCKSGRVPGQRGNTTPKASGSPGIVPKAAAAKGRGRPPRSIVQEATEMVASFSTSEVTAVLWWSGEQKTQLKKVKEVKATFDSRIQKASGPDAVDLVASLEPWHKRLGVIVLLMEAHQKAGFDTEAFVEVYDCCLTSLRICI